MKVHFQDKSKLVNTVFSDVYKKYDLMNDIMSLGVHRIWKKNMIDWIKPRHNLKLLDVASGTGDLAKIFSNRTKNKSKIICVEPNLDMLNFGRKRLRTYSNITWENASAEKLPFEDNIFDFYTISFGIRNVSNIYKCLHEAYRVLKPGGRFMCLEFSKIENRFLNMLYKQYSKTLPLLGKYIVGSPKSYEYLVKSIEEFYNQEELAKLMEKCRFSNVEFRNLSNGISAIHSGWKI